MTWFGAKPYVQWIDCEGRNFEEIVNIAAELFISRIEEMNERMGIPAKLDCIIADDIPELARLADKEANPLYPVPKLMTKKQLEAIYYQIGE